MIRLHLYISGRVQGVFYRQTTVRIARQLGLKGWVRNLPDGRVEAIAEGPQDAIASFLALCQKGPPDAQVTHLETQYEAPTGEFSNFETRL